MVPGVSNYTCPESDLLAQVGSSTDGLTAAAAAERLRETGPNAVAGGERHSFVRDILQRCRNPLVIQLLIIATVSYLMSDLRSTK